MSGKPNLQGYVLLGKKENGSYIGTVEHSFSLGLSKTEIRFWWSGKAVDNVIGAKYILDGKKNALHNKKYWVKKHPEIKFTVYNVDNPNLPIEIDWDSWKKTKDKLVSLCNNYRCYRY